MGEIGRAVDVTIRAVADYHAEASATPDLKEISGRKVEFDYLRVYVVYNLASVFVVGKRPCSYREGNRGVPGHIDPELGVGCRLSTHTRGSEGHLDHLYERHFQE
jgi:hypothetical protein